MPTPTLVTITNTYIDDVTTEVFCFEDQPNAEDIAAVARPVLKKIFDGYSHPRSASAIDEIIEKAIKNKNWDSAYYGTDNDLYIEVKEIEWLIVNTPTEDNEDSAEPGMGI
jgi:hypothetical protein